MRPHNCSRLAQTKLATIARIEWSQWCENSRAPARILAATGRHRKVTDLHKSRQDARGGVSSFFAESSYQSPADQNHNNKNNEHDHTPGTGVTERIATPGLFVDVCWQYLGCCDRAAPGRQINKVKVIERECHVQNDHHENDIAQIRQSDVDKLLPI